MLVELSIKQFAIIEQLTVSFDKGLTVLTGETGAGKSIIIDAIGLLLGGRGSAEYVRYGEKRAEIEGLFILEPKHPAFAKAEALGIQADDGMIVLRRDVTNQGKSICRINGKLVTLGILREIGQSLVDIHGQHEHQTLLHKEQHLSLLDHFAGPPLETVLDEYKELYKQYLALERQLAQLTENEKEMAQKTDLFQYQLKEIEAANLEPGEDKRLEAERLKLANAEKLFKSVHDAYNNLYGEGRGLEWINNALTHIEDASSYDPELGKLQQHVQEQYYLLEEAMFTLRDYLDKLEFDPTRLEMIESRLHELQKLKRKYGDSVDAIVEYASTIEEQLDSILHKDDRIKQLEQSLETMRLDLEVESAALTNIRKQIAMELTESIHEQLRALYMEKTSFEVKFHETAEGKKPFRENGVDDVEFYLSTNPGEPVKPLAKVASGGEISRIMLALKTIFSNHQGVTSVIFDEVDTGVSGRVAQAIAEKIRHISVGSQVLCISHLPQVAAMADTHLYISKKEVGGRVTTEVRALKDEEKVEEIARMIAGVEMTELTKEHAKELLDLATSIKCNH
ncbi:DNA repair protein RecN [Halalkalibacterium halodurans]|uniref:DNA repair protein RecN n=1 Tax=Halalkalibacterium halodurans (strain ATCC BAA-125 / DSM 18197 / FERM 7344 / JCM 9153 / C-125) TaxID=272558 RepID=RECN_HALH5|nr:DNA repair protein RecN [Halalkalibacterium halodurans]Q9K974.1 RecName: Full=DNA repair protein RecN; AltName: Full=Recombination protein N [Halalkalibacterium halodurans C-125]MED4122593.1 DNA repair protein RecN [Halalkalibacterium halodurans]MED4174166.1 DNA repair protein RecN [Halalkalibacterium halodurans]BAB06495.1 DNA repair and genetic recombination [Halalkalibacterium halodurans C-125]